ncbi:MULTISPECIES: TlpA family protein disulfide reductase [unclassified Flavobacterium]|jgi:peroxiredoxin|uniref:TlpA family protein disulfide reductase n=1 Tax=unclassified Flavobacterium TaxID=196869 RepID=UPI0009E28D85|nr:redoxin domain-containing protein [Flavobacterium sp. ABG]
MRKYSKIILLLLLVSFLSFMVYNIISKINHKKELAEHIKTIPAFNYQDLNGVAFTNKNLKTDIAVLFVYFNSDCEFCNEEAQMIQENIEKLSLIQVVFVSFEQVKQIKSFAQKHSLLNHDNIHFVSDTNVTFATSFDVKSLPCLVLYNKNQQLIEKIKGQTQVATILKKLTP